MKPSRTRPAFTMSQLLVLLALLLLFLGFLFSVLSRVRAAASKSQSQNNMKQILLGTISMADATNGNLPAGCDANNFSAFAHVLPYLEQDPLFKSIKFNADIDNKENAQARKTTLRTFINPNDPLMNVNDFGPTNYQFNGLAFPYRPKAAMRFPASFTDGVSQTVFLSENLKGDGNTRAIDVRRQHVVLPEKEGEKFKGEKLDEMGVMSFKEGKHIVGDRCASWMDGRLLQTVFLPGRGINDERPDAYYEKDKGERIGVTGPRSLDKFVNVGLGDGSVRSLTPQLSYKTWHAALTPSNDDVLGNDW